MINLKKTIILLSTAPVFLFAQFEYSILKISPEIEKRMLKGNSHKKDCPISLEDLRYLKLKHIDFNSNIKTGELIVHKSVSKEIVDIFQRLYEIKYPIKKMQLVSNYNGNDWDSIEANNTSAYNCRPIEGTKRWSRHAYGKAIDINPIQNPYISKKGKISHEASQEFRNRVRPNSFNLKQKAVILQNDEIVELFKKQKWVWGGDWITIKDYQHFDKRIP